MSSSASHRAAREAPAVLGMISRATHILAVLNGEAGGGPPRAPPPPLPPPPPPGGGGGGGGAPPPPPPPPPAPRPPPPRRGPRRSSPRQLAGQGVGSLGLRTPCRLGCPSATPPLESCDAVVGMFGFAFSSV